MLAILVEPPNAKLCSMNWSNLTVQALTLRDAQRWSLELLPRDPRLREQVVSVRVAGQLAALREVTVTMADGDRSVMRIEPAAAGPPGIPPATGKPASAPG